MRSHSPIALALAGALLLLAPAATLAAPGALEIQQQGDVRYVSGGIGDEQEQALKGMAGNYDLEVTFAADEGNYLGGADLVIMKPRAKTAVLRTSTAGPILLAELPPGRYELRATANGTTQSKMVDVSAHGRTSTIFHLGHLDESARQ